MNEDENVALVLPGPPLLEEGAGQSGGDERLLELWLHGKSPHTRRAYSRDLDGFFALTGRQRLEEMTLSDLQRFEESLSHLSPATRARKLSAVKSLLSFAQSTGYVRFNAGAALRAPRVKMTLAERTFEEPEVFTILALEPEPRNRVLLRLLYSTGVRVSELCALKWSDVKPRGESGEVTVFGKGGKGGKTRAIALSASTWRALVALRSGAADEEPVFASRRRTGSRRHLGPARVWQIVQRAAHRASIQKGVSPHWFRHAHASHALDRGAPVHMVKETLGHESLTTTGKYLHARPGDSSGRYLGI